MMKFLKTTIKYAELIPCMFRSHDYITEVIAESTMYDGNPLPRLLLHTCKRCCGTKWETDILDCKTNPMKWP
jgi:hypothetical protein